MRAPVPANEDERLETLRRYKILDTPPEMGYEDLTLLASEICGTPIAAISLVDEDRQWFKSILGLEVRQTSRDVAFCAHAILNGSETLVVEDAALDPRFVDNPLVTGQPGIRFYAGTPLVMTGGNALGTLCVIDRVPRGLTAAQRRALAVLGREVVAQLELRRSLQELERTVVTLARSEADLRQTQQEQRVLREEFFSHISHELRSPLTPVHQFLSIVLDEIAGPLTGDQREYLGIALRNVEQLRGMIGDLLELTRAQTGKMSIDRRRMRVEQVVADVVDSLSLTAKASGIDLVSQVAGPLPEVVGDAARVRQVVANLIENAIKFTGEGGSIAVRAGVPPEFPMAVRVTVEDSGCGLSPEDCARVFEQLYQVKDCGERSRNGLGLGLYISRELVQRQGGCIWVESELGQGSRFHFTLPLFGLEPLVSPLLTAENMAGGTFAVITITFLPPRQAPVAVRAEEAMDAAWETIRASTRAATDVVLPRLGQADRGETFVVVAMAGVESASGIVRRIEERLAAEDTVREVGYEARVRTTMFNLPDGASDLGPAAVASVVASSVTEHVEELCGVRM